MMLIIELVSSMLFLIPGLVLLGYKLYDMNKNNTLEGFVALWIYYGIFSFAAVGTVLGGFLGAKTLCLVCFGIVALCIIGVYPISWGIYYFVMFLVKIGIVPKTPVVSEDTPYMQVKGRIVKAKEVKAELKERVYRLIVTYEQDGMPRRAKTITTYSLSEIATIIRDSNEVEIMVRGVECILPPIDKEEVICSHDTNVLKKIKISNYIDFSRITDIPIYYNLLPLIGVIPAGVYIYYLFATGSIVVGSVVSGIIALFVIVTVVRFLRIRREFAGKVKI
ncbi:MAG: hypothetical protein IKJ30_05865 [Bacilli bacterium]|nr:hypothetical protein [Bacilli bacterium]